MKSLMFVAVMLVMSIPATAEAKCCLPVRPVRTMVRVVNHVRPVRTVVNRVRPVRAVARPVLQAAVLPICALRGCK